MAKKTSSIDALVVEISEKEGSTISEKKPKSTFKHDTFADF